MSAVEMSSKERVMAAFAGEPVDRAPVINPTSVITMDSMREYGLKFPDVHLDAEKMALGASAGKELLGFDSVMPKFSGATDFSSMPFFSLFRQSTSAV